MKYCKRGVIKIIAKPSTGDVKEPVATRLIIPNEKEIPSKGISNLL